MVLATGPPMIKLDNWKKKGQRLYLDYKYESSDEKGENVSPLGFSITYIYIYIAFFSSCWGHSMVLSM